MRYLDKIKQNIADLKKDIETAKGKEKKALQEELIQAESLLDKVLKKVAKEESTQVGDVTPTDSKGDNKVVSYLNSSKNNNDITSFISKLVKDIKAKVISKEVALASKLATLLEAKQLILLDLIKDIHEMFNSRYGIKVDIIPTKPNELTIFFPNTLVNQLPKDTYDSDMIKSLDKVLMSKHKLVYLATPTEVGLKISLATTQEELEEYTIISKTPEALNDGIIYLETKRRLSRLDRIYKLLNEYIPIKEEDENKVKDLIKQRLERNPRTYLRVVRDPGWFYNFAEDLFRELEYLKEEETLAEYTKKDIKKTKSKANTLLDNKFIWVFTVLNQHGDTIRDNIFGIDDAITEFIAHEDKAALLVAYPYIDPNPEDENVELIFADNPGPIILYDNEKATLPKQNLSKDLADEEKERIAAGEEDLGKHQVKREDRVSKLKGVLHEWVELDIEEIKLLDENDLMVLSNRLNTVLEELYDLQDIYPVDEDGNTSITLEDILIDLTEKAEFLDSIVPVEDGDFQEGTVFEDEVKGPINYPGGKGPKPPSEPDIYDLHLKPGEAIPNPKQVQKVSRTKQELPSMNEVITTLRSYFDIKGLAGNLTKDQAKEMRDLLQLVVSNNKANALRGSIMKIIQNVAKDDKVEQEVIDYLLDFGAFVGSALKPLELTSKIGSVLNKKEVE